MTDESKVLRLPVSNDKVTCHLTVPRFDYVIGLEDGVPSGLAALATEMEHVAEQFDGLASLFEDCPDATYTPNVLFVDGHLTFEFQVPRNWVSRLREMGWSPEDLDVQPGGRVSTESDFSDA